MSVNAMLSLIWFAMFGTKIDRNREDEATVFTRRAVVHAINEMSGLRDKPNED